MITQNKLNFTYKKKLNESQKNTFPIDWKNKTQTKMIKGKSNKQKLPSHQPRTEKNTHNNNNKIESKKNIENK